MLMNALKLLPVIISFLLLAAHFYRTGPMMLARLSLALLILLLLGEAWVARVIQVALILGSVEWLRTLYFIARERIALDQSWARMAIILGAVALFTALSSLVFRSKTLRARYASNDLL